MSDPYNPRGSPYKRAGVSNAPGRLIFGSSWHKDQLLYGEASGELLLFADYRMVPDDEMIYLNLIISWDTGRDLDICVWFNITRESASAVEFGTFGWSQTYNGSEGTVAFGGGGSDGDVWGKHYGDNTSSVGSETVRLGIPTSCVGPRYRNWTVTVQCHYAAVYYSETGSSAQAELSGGGLSQSTYFGPSPKGEQSRKANKTDGGGMFTAKIGWDPRSNKIVVKSIE